MGVIRYFCRHAHGDYGIQHKLGSEIGGGYIYIAVECNWRSS